MITISDEASDAMDFDVVVVGAGFAGLYMLHKLRSAGVAVHLVEAGDDVGGTWYWNRYPGAKCDVESLLYSFSFSSDLEQEWVWKDRYAGHAEIQSYLAHVADRFDLRRDISFGTTIQSAVFQEHLSCWESQGSDGRVWRSRFLVTAVGCLSACNVPDFAGLDTFMGRVLHTGAWPHEPVDFSNQKVAVVGTGSSGIQLIPQVAQQARQLTVFQRTPNYSLPARNRPLTPEEAARVKADYRRYRSLNQQGKIHGGGDTLLPAEQQGMREEAAFSVDRGEREDRFNERWGIGGVTLLLSYSDLRDNPPANFEVASFIRSKIKETVRDQEVAEKLCPTSYPVGSKRICVDTDYFETFNRDNVELIDLISEPIVRIEHDGILLSSGRHVGLDTLVLATGYDAITGPLTKMNIVGRKGEALSDHWREGPSAYLGLGITGFPNLFTITGPLSPCVAGNNAVLTIEQHVEWIADCLGFMRDHGFTRIEADEAAETDWRTEVNKLAENSIFMKGNSWLLGANIPGKPRSILAYIGGISKYTQICAEVAASGYRGFHFS